MRLPVRLLSRSMSMASGNSPQGQNFLNNGQAKQFLRSTLSRTSLHATSPLPQFRTWFTDAQHPSTAIPHPETCTLSTAELPSGHVSARVVYLKELDAQGRFVVYTNVATSRKARDIASNPHAALTFHWEPLERQVRVEGRAERNSREESQAYFDTRARGSRIGAWASRQSVVLEPSGEGDDGRAQLDAWVAEAERRFPEDDTAQGGGHIPVPEFWGGLRIIPMRVEFWQGRESRLHDRFVYTREAEGQDTWKLERLSP